MENLKHTPSLAGIDANGNVIHASSAGSLPNKIVVNVTTGNDVTAEKYTDKKFKTIAAALAASVSGDTIYVEAGLYDEGLLTAVDGVTLYMEYGATIAPTTNGGMYPIFSEELMPGGAGGPAINFKIRGRGRFINKGNSGPDTSAIEVSRNNSNWDIEAEEVSTFSTNRNITTNIIFRNTKFSYEIDIYGNSSTKNVIFDNCSFVNCNMSRRNFGHALVLTQFIKCKFIRTIPTIDHDIDYPLDPTNGLITFMFKSASGGQATIVECIDCLFYNSVGGDNIYLYATSQNANGQLLLKNCQFYTSDLAKASIVYDGAAATNPKFLLEGNIANTAISAANGATFANALSGAGIQVLASYKMVAQF